MNKEEIEELKDFTIDITDIDELALGLEVCSKKSNMVIQEFADTIIQLQQENKRLKEINEEHKKLNGELREENKKYKEVINKAIKCIDYNIKYRNGADIYQFVDIESEILEPLKFILELDEENGNAYLKEFNDWLKEVK